MFSLYVSDMPVLYRHVQLALYADATVNIVKSCKPALLVSCLEAYLSDLQRWLRGRRIAINVSKSKAMLFAKARWRVCKSLPMELLGEPIQWVDAARYLGVIRDTL